MTGALRPGARPALRRNSPRFWPSGRRRRNAPPPWAPPAGARAVAEFSLDRFAAGFSAQAEEALPPALLGPVRAAVGRGQKRREARLGGEFGQRAGQASTRPPADEGDAVRHAEAWPGGAVTKTTVSSGRSRARAAKIRCSTG